MKIFRTIGVLIIFVLIALGIALNKSNNLELWHALTNKNAFQTFMVKKWLSIVGDAMDQGTKTIVGINFIECGRVELDAEPSAATHCALEAFEGHTAFRVRYDLPGMDSKVAGGLAMTPTGDLYALDYDCDFNSISRQNFSKIPCPKPYKVFITKRGHVNCFYKTDEHTPWMFSPKHANYY